MRYDIQPALVREAAWEEGFAVTDAEAAKWLRRNSYAIKSCLDLEVREFLTQQMKTDFPEARLREIADDLIDDWIARTEALPEANGRSVYGFSYSADQFLRFCRAVLKRIVSHEQIMFEFKFEGDEN